MPKKKRLTHDEKIVKALEKIKTPIFDQLRNLKIYFKERSRSNETGIEHASKSYHNLDPSDIELLEETIKKPYEHTKDRRHSRTYCYYHRRKYDKRIFLKLL